MVYIHHRNIPSVLRCFDLGSSEEEAKVRLVIVLIEREAWIATIQETEYLLASQLKKEVKSNPPLAYEDLEFLIRCFLDKPAPVLAT